MEFVGWNLFCCLIDGFIERDCAITYTCITSTEKLWGVSVPALYKRIAISGSPKVT